MSALFRPLSFSVNGGISLFPVYHWPGLPFGGMLPSPVRRGHSLPGFTAAVHFLWSGRHMTYRRWPLCSFARGFASGSFNVPRGTFYSPLPGNVPRGTLRRTKNPEPRRMCGQRLRDVKGMRMGAKSRAERRALLHRGRDRTPPLFRLGKARPVFGMGFVQTLRRGWAAVLLRQGGPRRRRQAFFRRRWGCAPYTPQSPPLPAWWCGRARPRLPSGAPPC